MGSNQVGFVDLRVQIDNLKIAIELKYLVKKIEYEQSGSESFFLKDQPIGGMGPAAAPDCVVGVPR